MRPESCTGSSCELPGTDDPGDTPPGPLASEDALAGDEESVGAAEEDEEEEEVGMKGTVLRLRGSSGERWARGSQILPREQSPVHSMTEPAILQSFWTKPRRGRAQQLRSGEETEEGERGGSGWRQF